MIFVFPLPHCFHTSHSPWDAFEWRILGARTFPRPHGLNQL